MTSLTDVYDAGGGVVSRRRRYVGLALFGVGAAAVVAGIVLATTGVGDGFGLSTFGARELAGVLAGLGVPTAFLGSFTVLPAGRRTRAAAAIGGSLALFGVVLFREAYPAYWMGSTASPDLTLPVVVVYFVGAITTFWCLFVAVANLKRRNDPGGTVRMEVTEEGTTRILEVTGSVPGLGGIGMFGTDLDGEVETQTNEPASSDPAPSPQPDARPASDGGSAAQTADGSPAQPLDDEVVEAVTTRGQPDAYCGNCEHFQYVRVDGEIEPGCTLHREVLSDMDACDDWQANN
ncbi:MAG: hypothetical protein ABEJ31_03420 [Haloarculaceae archaeon]